MNTPGILNSAALLQSQAPAARQSEPSLPELQFKQVLSREVADRGNSRANPAPQTPETPPAQAQQGQPRTPSPVKNKADEPGEAKEVAEPPQDDHDPAPDAATAEMQAMVNNLVQAAAIAAEPKLASGASGEASAGAEGVRSLGAGRTTDLPASPGIAQLLDKTQPIKPDATLELPDIALTPADAAAVPTKTAAPALTELPRPAIADLPAKAVAAGIAGLQGLVPATAGLDAQSKTAPAGIEELVASARAAAAPESAGKARLTNPDAKGTEPKPGGPDLGAGAGRLADPIFPPNANGAPKALETPAAPALELAAARSLEAAPAPTPAMLGQLQQAAAFSAHAAAGHIPEKLGPPVGSPGWDQALGQKVVWMVAGGMQSASLTLNPPDLGPLQVVLSVSNSQANASFTAAQPEVRQALEAAMPRLREMLADSGIQLGQSSVSAGTPNQYSGPGEQSPRMRHFGETGAGLDNAAPTLRSPAKTGGQGLIDTFA